MAPREEVPRVALVVQVLAQPLAVLAVRPMLHGNRPHARPAAKAHACQAAKHPAIPRVSMAASKSLLLIVIRIIILYAQIIREGSNL